MALILVNRARLRIDAGDLAGADTDLVEARRRAKDERDDTVLGGCLLELGRVRGAGGDVAAALEILAEARVVAASVVDDHLAAEIHRHTAELLPGGSAEARSHLRAAYDLYVRIGDPWAETLAGLHPQLATSAL
jgi:hypothetical protein